MYKNNKKSMKVRMKLYKLYLINTKRRRDLIIFYVAYTPKRGESSHQIRFDSFGVCGRGKEDGRKERMEYKTNGRSSIIVVGRSQGVRFCQG